MKMYATAHVFQPGHRLELDLTSHDPSLMTVNKHAGTTFTVHLDPAEPAALRAPVFRGAFPASPTQTETEPAEVRPGLGSLG